MLVGAGVGVALMYLLDPDEGSARREQIQHAARERLAQASTAASARLEQLHGVVDRAAQAPAVQAIAARAADAARGLVDEFGHRASSAASTAQQQASDAAGGFQAGVENLHSHVAGTLNDLGEKYSGKASKWANDLKENAQARYGKWLNKSSLALGRDEDHRYVGQTVCALGSLALGAGAVYLFDPEQGHQRRSNLIGNATHVVQETGDFFRKAGRRLVTRGRAVARSASEQAADAVSHFRHSAGEQGPHTADSSQSHEPTQGQPATESTEASMGT
jgi:gas vesicle protein